MNPSPKHEGRITSLTLPLLSTDYHPSEVVFEPVAQKTKRLYYLDWLRVLAFAILITAHSAEVFADWHWWLKNSETSSTVGYIISFFRQWRMPLLFMISGTAVTMSLGRKSSVTFLKDRFVRLLLPLLAGMLLVIPPQLYYVRLTQGYTGSFWDFFKTVLTFKWFPAGNFHWMHLWYLAFVFAFTLVIVPTIEFLKSRNGIQLFNSLLQKLKHPAIFFSLAVLLCIPYYIINTIVPRSNLATLANYFPYFLIGALFLSEESFRDSIRKYRRASLFLATISAVVIFTVFIIENEFSNAINRNIDEKYLDLIFMPIESLNAWFWLVAIFGYSMKYLNFGTKQLSYANKAVYPFYIFHQTVIVIIGYYIVQLSISMLLKFVVILLLTTIFIWVIYEMILKRSALTRMLFGISN